MPSKYSSLRLPAFAIACVLALLILLCGVCIAQSPAVTSVTGHLQDVTGAPTAGTYAHFQLVNCSGARPQILGFTGIAPGYADFVADATGLISGTIWANDVIDCTGVTGLTRYQVTFVVNNVPQGPAVCYNVLSTGGAFNLDTAMPASPCIVATPTLPLDAFFHNVTSTGVIAGYNGIFNGRLSATSFHLNGAFTQCAAGSYITGLDSNFTPSCSSPSAGVVTFHGRAGAVVPVTGDYSCAQITGANCSAITTGAAPIVVSSGAVVSLAPSGVTAGTYVGATVTVDAHGLVTAISSATTNTGTATIPGNALVYDGQDIIDTGVVVPTGHLALCSPVGFTQPQNMIVTCGVNAVQHIEVRVANNAGASSGNFTYPTFTELYLIL